MADRARIPRTDAEAFDQEIARLRHELETICAGREADRRYRQTGTNHAVKAAVAAERQWWLDRFSDDTPCATMKVPECTHRSWSECVLAVAALRAAGGGEKR